MKHVLFLIIYFFCSLSLAKTCLEKRGALDFGSGTTKAYAAEVDVCEKRIVKVVFEQRLALALNEALERSGSNEIPSAVIESAIPEIQKLISELKSAGVEKVTAVATSVFRVAKNGRQMAALLSQRLNVPVTVISQNREAELGYWSAMAQKNLKQDDEFIVWDIGGGSMQMYARRQGKVHIYEGKLASVTFKNKILEVLQFKDPKIDPSPNPIGLQRNAAVQIAKNHAYMNVPKFFKDSATKARWIGVGGVISLSVQRQSNKDAGEFTELQLEEALKKGSLLKDEDIQSEYRISDISNLALVLGYMKALKIPKVETVQASLGQGLIFTQLHSH